MSKGNVKVERFTETVAKTKTPWVYLVAIPAVIGLWWTYNHAAGGCFQPSEWVSYCDAHPPSSTTIMK